MDVPAEIPYNSLERCNYRYLQKLAKSQGLPSNVKKEMLVKMIYAKKNCSPEQLASLITRVKEQRKLSSKKLKTGRRLKQLQFTRISSTSNPSPPICSTPLRSWSPLPSCSSQTPKTYSNINTIKRRGAESDRVLRSSNSKMSNTNFIKIEQVDIVSVEVNSEREEENQYEGYMHTEKYSPVQGDSPPQTLLSFKTNKPILYENRRQGEAFVRERPLVPFTSSSVLPRERHLSGISPLQPTQEYQPRQKPETSDQNGQILNAYFRKTTGLQSVLKNKITQTYIKRPIMVRKAVQKAARMYRSLSNSSTESARESGSDVEMKSRIMMRRFQNTFENVAAPKKGLRSMNKDYAIEIIPNTRAEINRAEQFAELQTKQNLKDMSHSDDGPKRNFYVINNQTRANVSAIDNRPKNVIGNRRHTSVTALDNRVKMSKKLKKICAKNQRRIIKNQMEMIADIDNFKELRAYIMAPSTTNQPYRYNDNDMPSGVKVVSKNVAKNRSSNLNFKSFSETLNYTDNTKNTIEYQNPVNTDVYKRSNYPNMSALTDVYPENRVEVISEADNKEVYYHKKIRAEQVRVKRLSLSLERTSTPTPMPTLPHITDVFNKLKDAPTPTLPNITDVFNKLKDTPISTLPPITDVFNKLKNPPNPTLPNITDVFNKLKDAPTSTLPRITDVFNELKDAPTSTLPPITDVFNKLKNPPNPTLPHIMDVFNKLKDHPTPSLPHITDVFNKLQDHPTPTVPHITDVFNKIKDHPTPTLPHIPDVFNKLKDHLTPTLPHVTDGFNKLKDHPTPTLPHITDVFNRLKDHPTPTLPHVTDVFNKLKDHLTPTLPHITDVFNKLQDPPTTTLPHITDIFNKLKDPRFHHLTQPLFVDCGRDAATALTEQPGSSKEMPGHTELIYKYLWSMDQSPDVHHTFRTTSTTTMYTNHLTTTSAICKSPVPCITSIESVQGDKPRNSVYSGGLLCLQDDLKTYEQEGEGTTCRQAVQWENPRESVFSGESTYLQDYLKKYERDGEGITCKEELPRSPLSDISGPTSFEDALDVISQDGDYMERIGMGVRMQCVVCDWAGPSNILEYHVELEHPSAMVLRLSPCWRSTVSLASAGCGSRQLSKYDGRIYVVSVACVGTQLRADIMMLPKDYDPVENTEKCGRITVYNEMTGEPYCWEGTVPTMRNFTDVNGLTVEFENLQLVPNDDLMFADGRWVNASNGAASQIDANAIFIVVHIDIY